MGLLNLKYLLLISICASYFSKANLHVSSSLDEQSNKQTHFCYPLSTNFGKSSEKIMAEIVNTC